MEPRAIIFGGMFCKSGVHAVNGFSKRTPKDGIEPAHQDGIVVSKVYSLLDPMPFKLWAHHQGGECGEIQLTERKRLSLIRLVNGIPRYWLYAAQRPMDHNLGAYLVQQP